MMVLFTRLRIRFYNQTDAFLELLMCCVVLSLL